MGNARWIIVGTLLAFAVGVPLLLHIFGFSENVAMAIIGYAVIFIGAPLEVMRRLKKLKDEERRRR